MSTSSMFVVSREVASPSKTIPAAFKILVNATSAGSMFVVQWERCNDFETVLKPSRVEIREMFDRDMSKIDRAVRQKVSGRCLC
jgi:hypothetical protein